MAIPGSNRDWSAPADNTETLPFECTLLKCIMRFATLKEMKLHKEAAPDHFYCKKCDVDCKDWDDLTQHMVTAMSPWVDGPMEGNREVLPKHIVCEFCGMSKFKTFGARRVHREQFHPAEQSITCPVEDCKTIFCKAAEFIRHFEDGRCEGLSSMQFQALLEQNHINKQIMKDTTISDRLQENMAAAQIRCDASTDTDTEFGGVALSIAPSVIDAEEDGRMFTNWQPLEPEKDLISLHAVRAPDVGSRQQWPPLPSSLAGSIRNMSITSPAPTVNRTELSASEFATRISKLRSGSRTSGRTTVYAESFPSLGSPSHAPSVTSDAASDVTVDAGGGRTASAWSTGATSKALFSNAKAASPSEYDEDSEAIKTKDLRHVRWWDPDHEDFEPDFFRNKDLMETRGFGCPFADCEDTYGYDSVDVLKAHIRLAHLTTDHRCPSCHKKFARPSAMMAHAESNGRCKVQGSEYFKALVADISGGYLKSRRVQAPKIFRVENALVLANGTSVNGVMQTEFQAKLPHKK